MEAQLSSQPPLFQREGVRGVSSTKLDVFFNINNIAEYITSLTSLLGGEFVWTGNVVEE